MHALPATLAVRAFFFSSGNLAIAHPCHMTRAHGVRACARSLDGLANGLEGRGHRICDDLRNLVGCEEGLAVDRHPPPALPTGRRFPATKKIQRLAKSFPAQRFRRGSWSCEPHHTHIPRQGVGVPRHTSRDPTSLLQAKKRRETGREAHARLAWAARRTLDWPGQRGPGRRCRTRSAPACRPAYQAFACHIMDERPSIQVRLRTCTYDTTHPHGTRSSRAVQSHPNRGQFDFVWLPARTPHGAYMWCLTARRNQAKYPPETYYRSLP